MPSPLCFSVCFLLFFKISPVWHGIQSERACTWHRGKQSQRAMESSSGSAVVASFAGWCLHSNPHYLLTRKLTEGGCLVKEGRGWPISRYFCSDIFKVFLIFSEISVPSFLAKPYSLHLTASLGNPESCLGSHYFLLCGLLPWLS